MATMNSWQYYTIRVNTNHTHTTLSLAWHIPMGQ
jgi:hypothetical protein